MQKHLDPIAFNFPRPKFDLGKSTCLVIEKATKKIALARKATEKSGSNDPEELLQVWGGCSPNDFLPFKTFIIFK